MVDSCDLKSRRRREIRDRKERCGLESKSYLCILYRVDFMDKIKKKVSIDGLSFRDFVPGHFYVYFYGKRIYSL